MFPELHFELVDDILARVGVKDLLRFRCVCKRWRSLFQEERFIRQHMSQSPTRIMSYSGILDTRHLLNLNKSGKFEFEEVKLNIEYKSSLVGYRLIGNCHGIFALHKDYKTFGTWNPSLKELRRIPTNLFFDNWAENGSGYDHSTQDYKIVLVQYVKQEGSCRKAQVLSLKSGLSRMIDFPCLEKFKWFQKRKHGTLIGDNIYWRVYDGDFNLSNTILSFNLVSETFNYFPGPGICNQAFTKFIQGLRGNLCTVGNDKCCRDMVVWSSQHDGNGVINSWSKIFSFSKTMLQAQSVVLSP